MSNLPAPMTTHPIPPAPRLQLALDDIDRADVLPLLDRVAGYVDIVEVGTPLIIRYGLAVVSDIKRHVPGVEVLCDAKIMDAAHYEASLAFDAGADYVTVLALTDDGSVTGCVRAAAQFGAKVMADLICVTDLAARATELQLLGVDVVAVHTGVDQQARGRTPLGDLRTLANSGVTVPIAVAGGITCDTAADYLALDPGILIVGSGITGAADAVAEAARMRGIVDGATR